MGTFVVKKTESRSRPDAGMEAAEGPWLRYAEAESIYVVSPFLR